MNKTLFAAMLAAYASAAWAAPQKIYFDQQGRPTDKPASYAYVREYTPSGNNAAVQDFYYPSRKKYSDPYRAPLKQIRQFVPQLENGTPRFKTASRTANGPTGTTTATNPP